MATKKKINLQNLPSSVRIIIAVVPAILIVVLFFFLVYKPKSAEIKKLKAEIVAQEQEIAKNEAKVAKLPELKKKYAALEFSLKVLSVQLPEEKEISDLLKKLSDVAVKSGLSITLWKPGAKAVHGSRIVYEIPVNVNMSGSYHDLGTFFSTMTKMNRIINISDVSLKKASVKKGEEGLDLLKIVFTAKTFSAIPEEEMAKAQAQTKGKGKRRR